MLIYSRITFHVIQKLEFNREEENKFRFPTILIIN
jgi:hypothetical protein